MPIPDSLPSEFRRYLIRQLQALETGPGPGIPEELEAALQDWRHPEALLQGLAPQELCIVLLCLMPQLQPDFLGACVLEAFPAGGDLPVLGGVRGLQHRGLLPTGETIVALLGGSRIGDRLRVQELLHPDAALGRTGLVYIESLREGEPPMSGRAIIPQQFADQLLYGREPAPRFGPEFPARLVSTAMEWADAVLPAHTRNQIADIGAWLEHQEKLRQDANLARKLKPGYRVLFYGPPGTGKTLTAALLGKEHAKDVYRIDLSQIVSKYIGETEKNLELVFRRAERKDWILFFDEADALFGKRTSVQSAHDKYANQETSYLLQRVEDYTGLLILASNFKNNLDDAFIRRFHAIVHFPAPNTQDRLALWERSLPASLPLDPRVNLHELAAHYELTGSGILNAVHYAVLHSYRHGEQQLSQPGLHEGIRKEFLKEEKVV